MRVEVHQSDIYGGYLACGVCRSTATQLRRVEVAGSGQTLQFSALVQVVMADMGLCSLMRGREDVGDNGTRRHKPRRQLLATRRAEQARQHCSAVFTEKTPAPRRRTTCA